MIEFRNVTLVQKKNKLLDRMCFKLKNGSVYGILADAERASVISDLLAGAALPTDGAVLINGFDLAKEARRAKAFLGYSPKSIALYDHMTPVEYLLFLADVRQIEYEQSIRRIGELLSLAGLSRKRGTLIKNLSFFEKKCLSTVQAILSDAEILILEDPFLDVQGREAEQLASLLEEMLDGRTAIICAQSAKYLRKCCDTLCRATSSSLTFEEETEIEEEAEQ